MQYYIYQYWHHSSDNCRMAPYCVKCDGVHQSINCDKRTGTIEQQMSVIAKVHTPPVIKFVLNSSKSLNLISTPPHSLKIYPKTALAKLSIEGTHPHPSITGPFFNELTNKNELNEIDKEFNVHNVCQLIQKYRNLLQKN